MSLDRYLDKSKPVFCFHLLDDGNFTHNSNPNQIGRCESTNRLIPHTDCQKCAKKE